MKLAIVGSRDFNDKIAFIEAMRKNHIDLLVGLGKIDMIISGGANGADSLGAAYAREKNIPLKEILPDWQTHGKVAGLLRNTDIIAAADMVIAFWDLSSRGTKDSVNKALMAGKPVLIVPVKPTPRTKPVQNEA